MMQIWLLLYPGNSEPMSDRGALMLGALGLLLLAILVLLRQIRNWRARS